MNTVIRILELYGDRELPLHVRGEPWKVAIGCILSQRTKDETTDAAFKRLIDRFPTLKQLAEANVKEVEKLIYPVGFYRQKARRIVEAAKYMLTHGVGTSLEELVKIPGIGRKCANIILSYGYGMPAIAVDTHVYRVSKRLGIVGENASEEEVEEALKGLVPRDRWIEVNNALVKFGKTVCKPLRPLCDMCPVRDGCKYFRNRIEKEKYPVAHGSGGKEKKGQYF